LDGFNLQGKKIDIKSLYSLFFLWDCKNGINYFQGVVTGKYP
jgi:hypothetical protein